MVKKVKTTRYTFKIPIGDWSGDGHGQCDWFIATAAKPIEEVREAFFTAKKLFPHLDPEQFCHDYEDSFVPSNIVAELATKGIHIDSEDFDPEGMARVVVWFLNQGDPELSVELIPEADVPMLPFYGSDKKKRDIGFIGYGLFY
jgi:hypothetical protein